MTCPWATRPFHCHFRSRRFMSLIRLLPAFAYVCLMCVCSTASAQDRDVTCHDPVIGKDGETYYLFSTGRGIHVKSSQDSASWKDEPRVFDETPEWVTEVVPDFRGDIWAPDIFHHEGAYYRTTRSQHLAETLRPLGLPRTRRSTPKAPTTPGMTTAWSSDRSRVGTCGTRSIPMSSSTRTARLG